MTTVETRPEHRPLSERLWNGTPYAALAGWLLIIVATVLVGERSSSWSDVQRLVASGEVDSVGVSNELPAGSTGYAVVTVHWRDGLLHRQAQVVQAQGSRQETSGASNNGVRTVVRAAPSDVLTATAPGLQVRRDDGSSTESSVFGWLVTSWIRLTSLLLFLVNFGLLIAGPQTWRATPWAWGGSGCCSRLSAASPSCCSRVPSPAHRCPGSPPAD